MREREKDSMREREKDSKREREKGKRERERERERALYQFQKLFPVKIKNFFLKKFLKKELFESLKTTTRTRCLNKKTVFRNFEIF
jgi:hypothetical protein